MLEVSSCCCVSHFCSSSAGALVFAISIPLSVLWRDLVSGTVELRDPERILHALLGVDRFTLVDGWRISVYVDVDLWKSVLVWFMSERLFPAVFQIDEFIAGAYMRLPSSSLLFYSRSEHYATSENCPCHSSNAHELAQPASLDLDFVPHTLLEQVFRRLHALLPKNAHITLYLTTRTAPTMMKSVFDSSFALAALPFLPSGFFALSRRKNASRRNHDLSARTSLALTASLHHVIENLSSRASPFTLISAEDVSATRSDELRGVEEALQCDRRVRADTIARCGVEGWREAYLRAEWEAALLDVGALRRWKIVIRK
ncbi:hypothetical protein EW146_g3306 [Bondarzewia mesenterica]|uniref:Uncharacterized protein n=1 Tax=Bondarzewia mesenterica TaxID=1095465 RepID=A0A4S4LXY2_9AGAM|nr:hypothetical protein EW146_g3306 [Bondarzewia mesenterica]